MAKKTVTAEITPRYKEPKSVSIREAEGGFIVSYNYDSGKLDEVCKTLDECLECASKHFGKKTKEDE